VINSKLKRIVRTGIYTVLLQASGAHAENLTPIPEADNWTFKLTPSYYSTTNTRNALDLNLRANHGSHAIWLGDYRRDGEFEQTRTGYEYTAQFPFGQLIPSIQAASHGFLGGSINAQIGNEIYALLGVGRTNLKDYYNLNFDPNDSILYGFGTNLLTKSTLSLYEIKDDRLNTGQAITHAVWHYVQNEDRRWSVDLSAKHGRVSPNDDYVCGNALALTYDYQGKFVRLAKDNKVNFTRENQIRLTAGLRF